MPQPYSAIDSGGCGNTILIQLVPRATTRTKKAYRPIWAISTAQQQRTGPCSIGTTKNQKLTPDNGASGTRQYQFKGPRGQSIPGASKIQKAGFANSL